MARRKRGVAICDRTGAKHKYKDMVIEPGTGYFVHKSASDGAYNLKDHPQNHLRRHGPDPKPLKHARPDRDWNDPVDFIPGDDND